MLKSASGGVCLGRGGAVSAPGGVCLFRGGGVCLVGGSGVCSGGGVVSQHALSCMFVEYLPFSLLVAQEIKSDYKIHIKTSFIEINTMENNVFQIATRTCFFTNRKCLLWKKKQRTVISQKVNSNLVVGKQ